MDVRVPPQNPCRVIIPKHRTAQNVAVMFYSLAKQLERHPADTPVKQLRFVQMGRSVEVELEYEAAQSTLFGGEGGEGGENQ